MPVIKSKEDIVDNVSVKVLKECYRKTHRDLIPIFTIGDGNCLTRAVSKALYGKDDCWAEIRYRILVELITKKKEFLNYNGTKAKKPNNQQMSWFDLIAPYGED